MADEQAGIPVSKPMSITDRIAAQFGIDADDEPSTEPEGPEGVSANTEEEPEQTEEQEVTPVDSGYEEVELDGETYKVPPKLKEAVLRQSDYTKKTQELAEHRRALQSQIQAVQIAQRFQQETAEDQAQLKGLEAQIQQYKNVNWQELDSETLIRAKHGLDQLKEQANELRGKLGQKAQQFQQMSQQAINQFRAQRADSLQRLVPGWNSQADIDATRAALETGFTPDEIRDSFDARMGLMAWKAAQFDKLQTTKTAAVQQVKNAPPVIKPGAVNQMPAQVKQKLAYRKELATAKTSQDRAKVIQKRIEGMFK